MKIQRTTPTIIKEETTHFANNNLKKKQRTAPTIIKERSNALRQQ